MRVPHGEGVANHTDPESCVAVCEDRREALTGDATGWVLSHEIAFRMLTRFKTRKATHGTALLRAVLRSGAVEDPSMPRRFLHGNREVSRLTIDDVDGPHREGESRSR